MRWAVALLILILFAAFGLSYWSWKARTAEQRFDPYIRVAAQKYHIDPLLIRALIWRETNFDPNMVGLAKERGLMQVTPVTGQEWATASKKMFYHDDDLFDPETNIDAGAWYLSRAIKRWPQADDPVPFALAEYNAGRTNALRWVDAAAPNSSAAFLKQIDYPSTRRYVETILQKYHEYQNNYFRPPWHSWPGKIKKLFFGRRPAPRSPDAPIPPVPPQNTTAAPESEPPR